MMQSRPFGHPLYVMLKPVGATCNLRCDYCYYLEKKHLAEGASPTTLSDELLERFVHINCDLFRFLHHILNSSF